MGKHPIQLRPLKDKLKAKGKTSNKSTHIKTWRRKWQPTQVFLPGESHGQKSLAGHSHWGRKELDTTK